MNKENKTIWERIVAFFLSILNAFGLYTTGQYYRRLADMEESYQTRLNDSAETYAQLKERYDEGTARINELLRSIDTLTKNDEEMRATLDHLKAEATRYRDEVPAENVDMIKNLQRQIHEIYANSLNFGFPNPRAIPGSISMTDSSVRVEGDEFYDARMRMINMDEETMAINGEPDQKKRFSMMVNFMRRRGLMERIGERMIASGAATLAIAYNSDCTNYELFVEIAAKVLPDAGTIKVIEGKEVDP